MDHQTSGPRADVVPGPFDAVGTADSEARTRRRVLDLIVTAGPISAAELGARLDLTAAAVRRHLTPLQECEQVTVHDGQLPGPVRRGRPAKRYVVTSRGQSQLPHRYSELAEQALRFLSDTTGEAGVRGFAAAHAGPLEARLSGVVSAHPAQDVADRVAAVASALDQDGYAASVRPVPGAAVLQLCLGHCPVQDVASAFPQLCDAETQVLSRVLGVHVQRLATLASGGHVCTTSIPTSSRATNVEGRTA